MHLSDTAGTKRSNESNLLTERTHILFIIVGSCLVTACLLNSVNCCCDSGYPVVVLLAIEGNL